MADNYSNATAVDTPEALKAEREDFDKTIASVRQMARDFDTLTEQRRWFDPKKIAFHLQLKGPHMRICVWKGILSPEAFQPYKESIARKKALGEQVLKDVATFSQALIHWEEDLVKREKIQQQYVASLLAHSVPMVTGRNAWKPVENGEPDSPDVAEQGTGIPKKIVGAVGIGLTALLGGDGAYAGIDAISDWAGFTKTSSLTPEQQLQRNSQIQNSTGALQAAAFTVSSAYAIPQIEAPKPLEVGARIPRSSNAALEKSTFGQTTEIENTSKSQGSDSGASKAINVAEGQKWILDSIPNINPTGGTMNCTNCAIATDATLAGRTAFALPGIDEYPSVLEDAFGGFFEPVRGPVDIERILSQSGNGARGVVIAHPWSGNIGHVFNVINDNGNIEFIDGQTGVDGALNFFKFKDFEFMLTSPGKL